MRFVHTIDEEGVAFVRIVCKYPVTGTTDLRRAWGLGNITERCCGTMKQ
jgi:hypothetical protein